MSQQHTAEKKDLETCVTGGKGVTWNDIRKVFLKVGFQSFCDTRLCALIYVHRFDAELPRLGKGYKTAVRLLNLRGVSGEDFGHLNDKEKKIACAIYSDYIATKKQLVMDGLIKPSSGNGDYYAVTDKGHTLKCQPTTQPITRAKAEQLLKDTISKAAQFNENPDSPHLIQSLHVYGSYLSDKQLLGDLDIAYETKPNLKPNESIRQWRERERAFFKKHRRAYLSTLFSKLIKAPEVSLCTLGVLDEMPEAVKRCVYELS